MSDMVEIAALWIGEKGDGEKFMSGYFGNAKLLVFKNKFKEKDNHPDYKVYVVKKDRKDPETKDIEPDDNDIPF